MCSIHKVSAIFQFWHGQVFYLTLTSWANAISDMDIMSLCHMLHCVMGKCSISYGRHNQVLYLPLRQWQVLYFTLPSWARCIVRIASRANILFHIASRASAIFYIVIIGECYNSQCVMGKCYILHWRHGQVLYFTFCHAQVLYSSLTVWARAETPIDIMAKCYI